MEWLNIKTASLRAPEYIGSAPIERATWFNVISFCVEQENGGRIIAASKWKCRQWQQTCGVTLREIKKSAQLLVWDGDDLLVWNYPLDKEHQVKSNRVNGSKGGVIITQAKTQAAKANGAHGGRPQNPSETQANNPSENPTEGNRKGNRKGNTAPDGAHVSLIDMWTREYEQVLGEKYAFQSGKDGNAVKQLLLTSHKTPEEVMRVARAAWKRIGEFPYSNASALSSFNSQFNQIRAALNVKSNGSGTKPMRSAAEANG